MSLRFSLFPHTFAAVILFGIFLLPSIAGAQGFVTCDGFFENPGGECNFCHFISMVNRIITWLIGVLFVIFAIVMVVAGLRLVTSGGDTSAYTSAKGMFTNAIIGIIIVFAAWLIVDSIMKVLLNDGTNPGFIKDFGPWNTIQCATQASLSTAYFAGGTFSEVNFSDNTPPLTAAQGFRQGLSSGEASQHAAAVTALQNAGVQVWSSGQVAANCNSNACTSLQGLRNDTLNQTLAIKQACPACQVTVTGATEGGHAGGQYSHANGYKIDIDDTPALNSYLESTLTRSGTRTGSHGGPRYVDSCGNEYVKESSHWDISITNGVCQL